MSGNQNGAAAPAAAGTPATVVNLTSNATNAAATATNSAPSIYQQLQAFREQRTTDLAQLTQDLQKGDLTAAQSDFAALTALGQNGPSGNGQVFTRADRAQDFAAIGTALQNGDLTGAQTALTALNGTFGQNQRAQAAVSAYTPHVTEIVINFGPEGAGRNATKGAIGAPEIVINLGAPSSSGSSAASSAGGSGSSAATTPELVINLGQAANGSAAGSSAGGLSELVINMGGGTSTGNASGPIPSEPIIQLNLESNSSSTLTLGLSNTTSGEQLTVNGAQQQNGSASGPIAFNLSPNTSYELILNLLNSSSTSAAGNGLSVSA